MEDAGPAHPDRRAVARGGRQETVLWMELWVRSLRDPQVAATRERLDRRWRETIART